jgi:hypothetical protein
MTFMEPSRKELVTQALAAFPDYNDARKYLAGHGYQTTSQKLEAFGVTHAEEIAEKKGLIAPLLEAQLANDMLDNARLASIVERQAIKKTRMMLKEGKISDPSRVARDLSQLKTQAIDKRLALQGRPTTISASVNVDGLIDQLEAMGVAKRADVEGTAVEIEA